MSSLRLGGTAVAAGCVLLALGMWLGRTLASDVPAEESTAVTFARDMADHHAQAVEMAEIIRDRSADPELLLIARDIALTQQSQIGRMQGWLDAWDLPLNGSSGGGSHDGMPGMASREDISSLRNVAIADAERYFLRLMIAHHAGGVSMASEAVEADVPDEVRRLANAIVDSQRTEITRLQELADRRSR